MPLNHSGRARDEGAVVVREDLRLVMEHPGLTFEDVGIEGIVVLPFLHAANEEEDCKDDSANTQDTSSDSTNNSTGRDGCTRAGDISART